MNSLVFQMKRFTIELTKTLVYHYTIIVFNGRRFTADASHVLLLFLCFLADAANAFRIK